MTELRSREPVGHSEGNFTIAIAQCRSVVGAVEDNLDVVKELCARASENRADLILFPECHASGYSYRDLAGLVQRTAEPVNGPIGFRLGALAREFSLVVCCGMFEVDEACYYNTQIVAFPDGRLEKQRKGISSCSENGVLSFEAKRQVFSWKGFRFGILVCADNSLPDYPEQFKRLDISLLLHPSAGRLADADSRSEERLEKETEESLRRACRLVDEMNVSYAVANPIGFSGEDYYSGNSWIMHPRDGLLAHLSPAVDAAEMSLGMGTIQRSC